MSLSTRACSGFRILQTCSLAGRNAPSSSSLTSTAFAWRQAQVRRRHVLSSSSVLSYRHQTLSGPSRLFSTSRPDAAHSGDADSKPKNNDPTGTDNTFSVNQEEIAKFAAMSDEWWAPHGPFRMLHLMNPPRIRYIRNRLEASGAIGGFELKKSSTQARFPLQGLSILDVGCGGGLLSEALARLGAQVTGLDASNENIQMAKIHARKDPLLSGGGPGSIEYRHQTAEQLLEEGRQFDVVCSMEVIEHVDRPAEFLKVLGHLVKPNGDLMLSTMSRTPLAYFLTVFSAEHLLRMVPVGTHDWSKYITPDELEAGVEDLAQCKVLNIQGICFNPLSGQWELASTGRSGSRSGIKEDSSRSSNSQGPLGFLSSLGASASESVNYFLAAKKVVPVASDVDPVSQE